MCDKTVLEKLLVEEFKTLDVELNKEVLAQCVTLCSKYNISAEDFASQWIAFTLSKSLDPEPTIPALSLLERKELVNLQHRTPVSKKSNLKIYQSSPKTLYLDEITASYKSNNELQPENANKRHSSSENDTSKRRQGDNKQKILFSFHSYSPKIAEKSTKYSERTDSGAVQCTFGGEEYLSQASWKGKNVDVTVTLLNKPTKIFTYMFDLLPEIVDSQEEHANYLAKIIINENNLSKPRPINIKLKEPATVYGQICGDRRGELDDKKIQLECTAYGRTRGAKVNVSLRELQQYSLFRGQTVVFKAKNRDGQLLIPTEIYCQADAPFPKTQLSIKESSLQIVVTAGPYTLDDNLLYEPLTDIISYVKTHKPDVVIMIGPFISVEQQHMVDGTLAESYDELFERLIAGVMQPLKDLRTQIILVSSYKDAHHHFVYPTFPYVLKQKYRNLHLLPDPCTIDLNGLVISATSVDVLKHLSTAEICQPTTSDRASRLSSHIIAQRCMYPLVPLGSEIPLESERWGLYTKLDYTPHILILPSTLRYFIKEIRGCIVINPEAVAKGYRGGTFARLEVFPNSKENSVKDNILCQIIKV